MKKILLIVILAAVVIYGAMYFFDADVAGGALPNVDVTGGALPNVDINGPDVNVQMEEKVIEIPTMSVDVPADKPELPDVDVETETRTIEVPSDVNVQ